MINKIYVFMTKLIYWLTIKWQFFIIFMFYKIVLITCDKQLHDMDYSNKKLLHSLNFKQRRTGYAGFRAFKSISLNGSLTNYLFQAKQN